MQKINFNVDFSPDYMILYLLIIIQKNIKHATLCPILCVCQMNFLQMHIECSLHVRLFFL